MGVYTLFLRVQRKRTSSEAAKERAAGSLAAALLVSLRLTTLCCS
jgi:hypothetical protein